MLTEKSSPFWLSTLEVCGESVTIKLATKDLNVFQVDFMKKGCS